MSSEQKSDKAALPIWGLQILPGVLGAVAATGMLEICPTLGQVTAICGSLSFPEIFQSLG